MMVHVFSILLFVVFGFVAQTWGEVVSPNTRINLREKASSTSKSLRKIEKGEPLTVEKIENGWMWVKTSDGQKGYVNQKVVFPITTSLKDIEKKPEGETAKKNSPQGPTEVLKDVDSSEPLFDEEDLEDF